MRVVYIIIACWLAFLAYWALNAGWSRKTVEEQPWQNRLKHSIPVWIAALLILRPIPRLHLVLIPHSALSSTIGVVLCVAGLAGAIWARRSLGDLWSAAVVVKEEHQVIERGPYAVVRHPIYSAILLMYLGSAIASGSASAFVGLAFLFAGFWMKLKDEEAMLSRRLPGYDDYRHRVKALIPLVL